MLAFIVGLHAEARLLRPLRRPVFVGGGDAAGAAIAVARAQAAGARALVSFGLAGGLDPGLAPGSLIVPRVVAGNAGRQSAAEAIGLALGGFTCDTVWAGASIVASAIDKAALFAASGAAAVDLESGSVAAAGLPFGVLRAVCDPAGRDLPPAALAALDRAGMIGIGRMAASLARHPGQIGALTALARDAGRAQRELARHVSRLTARNSLQAWT
jgi:adenosylhomocysteine nucleosidase